MSTAVASSSPRCHAWQKYKARDRERKNERKRDREREWERGKRKINRWSHSRVIPSRWARRMISGEGGERQSDWSWFFLRGEAVNFNLVLENGAWLAWIRREVIMRRGLEVFFLLWVWAVEKTVWELPRFEIYVLVIKNIHFILFLVLCLKKYRIVGEETYYLHIVRAYMYSSLFLNSKTNFVFSIINDWNSIDTSRSMLSTLIHWLSRCMQLFFSTLTSLIEF